MDVPVSGLFSLVKGDDTADLHARVRHYQFCKRLDPDGTSALVCIPARLRRNCAYLTKGMHELGRLPGDLLFGNGDPEQHVAFYDAPRASGMLAASALPSAIRTLRTQRESSGVTFVFDALVAGARASALWDSGAKLCFASRSLVRHLGLSETACVTHVALADGSTLTSQSAVCVRVRIVAYRETLNLVVLDLAPGFDLV